MYQRIDNQEKVISFANRKITKYEQNYTTAEKECLTVVWAIQREIEYLKGMKFTVITDHLALKWIFKHPNPTGRLGRWALELRSHDFDIEYRKGKLNVLHRMRYQENQYQVREMKWKIVPQLVRRLHVPGSKKR